MFPYFPGTYHCLRFTLEFAFLCLFCSRTFLSIIGGVVAGILGFTGLTGFVFYLLLMAVTSLGLVAKAKFSIHTYFDSWNRVLLDGFLSGLMVCFLCALHLSFGGSFSLLLPIYFTLECVCFHDYNFSFLNSCSRSCCSGRILLFYNNKYLVEYDCNINFNSILVI